MFKVGFLPFKILTCYFRNKFSYTVVSSKIFCEASRGRITCFAFLVSIHLIITKFLHKHTSKYLHSIIAVSKLQRFFPLKLKLWSLIEKSAKSRVDCTLLEFNVCLRCFFVLIFTNRLCFSSPRRLIIVYKACHFRSTECYSVQFNWVVFKI
jgi:hypothetical protein